MAVVVSVLAIFFANFRPYDVFSTAKQTRLQSVGSFSSRWNVQWGYEWSASWQKMTTRKWRSWSEADVWCLIQQGLDSHYVFIIRLGKAVLAKYVRGLILNRGVRISCKKKPGLSAIENGSVDIAMNCVVVLLFFASLSIGISLAQGIGYFWSSQSWRLRGWFLLRLIFS